MSKKVMAVVAVVALVAILGICLVACNAESYEKKLEKKDYYVTSYTADKDDASIEWGVVAKAKGLNLDHVTVIKYTNTDDAKDAEEASIKLYGEKGTYRIGKIVISGTEQGVKDAK